MSEQNTETPQEQVEAGSEDGFKSEESKKAVLADLARERDARKSLQARVDEFEAEKAAAEKAHQEAIELAQSEVKESVERAVAAETRALRFQIANSHGITEAEDIELLLTGSDEETLTAQAKRLSDQRKTVSTTPKPDLTQGASGESKPASNADVFAQQLSDF